MDTLQIMMCLLPVFGVVGAAIIAKLDTKE